MNRPAIHDRAIGGFSMIIHMKHWGIISTENRRCHLDASLPAGFQTRHN